MSFQMVLSPRTLLVFRVTTHPNIPAPDSMLLLVLRNSSVAPFSFLRKTDSVESLLFCCCDNKRVCVFPHSFLLWEELKKCQVISSPQHIYIFLHQNSCFVLIWCPFPKKKNLLLDRQLPQTLNKRIKENCLCCTVLLEAPRHNV